MGRAGERILRVNRRSESVGQYRESSGLRFLGVRRSLKNAQSGHQASGLKLVPAIGSTSRCPQHSGPSSGGRRHLHDLNLMTASETDEDAPALGGSGVEGGAGANGSVITGSF